MSVLGKVLVCVTVPLLIAGFTYVVCDFLLPPVDCAFTTADAASIGRCEAQIVRRVLIMLLVPLMSGATSLIILLSLMARSRR
jgi:hypothetical protein